VDSLVTVARPNLDSPLRYPGGKSSLTGFLAKCASRMPDEKVTYIEPFAGGAGAATSLLVRGLVERIVINDLDPAVFSFWQAVFCDGERFARRVHTIPLTLKEWDRQRSIYYRRIPADDFELGFSFFYLNRTNRSGVLNAGVIGGRAQNGRYKIGERFNRHHLASRIEALHARRKSVEFSHDDGRKVIEHYSSEPGTLIYADPPYVKMGGSLYYSKFDESQHQLLSVCLNRNRSAWWFLTYDDAPLIRELYAGSHLGEYSLHWSANNKGMSTELYALSDPLFYALTEKD